MKAATERKIIRWFHILASIPIVGYIYGPVASMPEPAFAIKFVILPAVILSGFWLWLGHHVRKWFRTGWIRTEKGGSFARKQRLL